MVGIVATTIVGCATTVSGQGAGLYVWIIFLMFGLMVTVTVLRKLSGGSRARREGKRRGRNSGSDGGSGCSSWFGGGGGGGD